jgi:hypothetical protein
MSSSAITGPLLSDVSRSADGSAAAPSWSFQNSPTMGFYRVSANVLGLSTAGVQRMVVDASGNVGIGTTSPAQSLHVNTAQANIRLESSSGTNNALMRCINTGGTAYVGLDNNVGGLGAAYGLHLFHSGAYPIVFTTNGTERARIDASGNATIGQTSGTTEVEHSIVGYRTGGSSAAMNFQNRSTSTACPAFNVIKGSADTTTGHRLATFTVNGGASGAGQINVNGANACAFGSYSDRRLKENVVSLSGELEKVLALNPVEFDYIEGGHQVGFIAQEIEEIYPDAVSILGETDEMKMVTGWDKTTARLVKAIQELSAKVDAQAAEGAALRSEIEALKAQP